MSALTDAIAATDLNTITATAPERGREIETVPGLRDRLAGIPVTPVPGLLIPSTAWREEERHALQLCMSLTPCCEYLL